MHTGKTIQTIFLISVLSSLLQAEEAETAFQRIKSSIETFTSKGTEGEINELARVEANIGPSLTIDEYVQVYLKMLVILESRIDPNFDFVKEEKYPMHPEPPKGYDSGVSADAVRDEAEKTAYLRRIREHKARTTKFLNQTAALQLKERIVANFAMIGRSEKGVTESPIKIPALGLISQSSLSEALKTRLNEALETGTAGQVQEGKR